MHYKGITRAQALELVGAGWNKLINNIYNAKPENIEIIQVKEKFGGLRVSAGSFYRGQEWFLDLIDYYEEVSKTICEQCGQPSKIRTDIGWLQSLCEEHYKEYKNTYGFSRRMDIDGLQ